MLSLSREHLKKRFRELRAGLQHAFATQAASQPLSAEDIELMERMADTVVYRGMAAPATVFLESIGPMSFLGSQALHFFTPIIEVAFNAKEVEQVARLLERRESAALLIALIEAKAAAKRASAQ
jgi:hypothetical protein